MRHTKFGMVLGSIALAAACGDDGPTGKAGVVQVANYTVAPQLARCGVTLTNPLSWATSPDTVLLQAQVINTTANDVTLSTAGIAGIIIRSSIETEVSQSWAAYNTLPYTPKDGVVPAKVGDVTLRASIPVIALCNAKPAAFESVGWREVDVSLRVTTSGGQYVTVPATLRVTWD